MASILVAFPKGVSAAPIRFDQVIQIVNARPAQGPSSTSTLLVAGGTTNPLVADDDERCDGHCGDDRLHADAPLRRLPDAVQPKP